jgi:hypothetical protein
MMQDRERHGVAAVRLRRRDGKAYGEDRQGQYAKYQE